MYSHTRHPFAHFVGMDVLPRSKLNSNKGFQIYIVYDGCSPAQFYREAVMEKSKEEMMEVEQAVIPIPTGKIPEGNLYYYVLGDNL